MNVITREEFYGLVWSKPMTKVAQQFKVSGSYMARVRSFLQVPRPERGYWAKLAVGKDFSRSCKFNVSRLRAAPDYVAAQDYVAGF